MKYLELIMVQMSSRSAKRAMMLINRLIDCNHSNFRRFFVGLNILLIFRSLPVNCIFY